jgi:predicted nucleic acid-binding protein
MNKKLKIYLDTSVINFLFSEQSPEKKEITIDFFQNYVSKEIFDVYISPLVIEEINRTNNVNKLNLLLNVVRDFNLKSVDITQSEEIISLANEYLSKGVLPKNSEADALHIAICIINNIDILLTWNFKHLANINRRKKVYLINIENNYNNSFEILTPMEVVYEFD